MANVPIFELWLEFEHWEAKPDDNPTDDFFNMIVRVADGRRYALNVWTFKFLHSARFPWPYDKMTGEPAAYVVPPDLFVERLDRPLLERTIAELLANDAMQNEWLAPLEE